MDEEEEQNEAFIKMGDEVDELNVKQENENMAARPKISLNNEKRAQEEPIETCEVEQENQDEGETENDAWGLRGENDPTEHD